MTTTESYFVQPTQVKLEVQSPALHQREYFPEVSNETICNAAGLGRCARQAYGWLG